MTLHGSLFVVSNIVVVLGYVFLGAFIIPRIAIKLTRTKIGGAGFFLLCGLHHLDNVLHYIYRGGERLDRVYSGVHMNAIDVPQAICVWLFISGLYIEFVKWGPWGAEQDESVLMDLAERQGESDNGHDSDAAANSQET